MKIGDKINGVKIAYFAVCTDSCDEEKFDSYEKAEEEYDRLYKEYGKELFLSDERPVWSLETCEQFIADQNSFYACDKNGEILEYFENSQNLQTDSEIRDFYGEWEEDEEFEDE